MARMTRAWRKAAIEQAARARRQEAAQTRRQAPIQECQMGAHAESR